MLGCHLYQRNKVSALGLAQHTRILNGACKEDPAALGKDFGAINMDVNDFDPQERLSLYSIPNFVRGSLLDIPFAPESFDIVVLGEILEHCPTAAADQIMQQVHRVLAENGHVVVTVPLDPRRPEVQHEPHLLITWEGGITSWHQTVWHDADFAALIERHGFEEMKEHRQQLHYGFCDGTGAVLRKRCSSQA